MITISAAELPVSKSELNRALIVKSYFPSLNWLEPQITSEDSKLLAKALWDVAQGKTTFYLGEGAAPFRFLFTRLTRLQGEFTLQGRTRLLERVAVGCAELLPQLGGEVISSDPQEIKFRTSGKWPLKISLPGAGTSQLMSGLLLSSWQLPHDLEITSEDIPSASYLSLTIEMLESLGWRGDRKGNSFLVRAPQTISDEALRKFITLDVDMSCAAVVGALGLVSAGVKLSGLATKSRQGDREFFEILKRAKVKLVQTTRRLIISSESYSGFSENLRNYPDLFPVLAALAPLAESPSELSGLENLNSKESARLDNMISLLRMINVDASLKNDTLRINPVKEWSSPSSPIHVPDFNDHRMAMATAILAASGAPLEFSESLSVHKSFPNFWEIYRRFL